jgi:selenocysteine lyase/cysteine desulfurase
MKSSPCKISQHAWEAKPTGAIRVSLGIARNKHDIERLLRMLKEFRDAKSGQFVSRL